MEGGSPEAKPKNRRTKRRRKRLAKKLSESQSEQSDNSQVVPQDDRTKYKEEEESDKYLWHQPQSRDSRMFYYDEIAQKYKYRDQEILVAPQGRKARRRKRRLENRQRCD